MRYACIDIGSNTTRLLVAELTDGTVRPVVQRRAFTHLGRALGPDGELAPGKLEDLGAVVSEHARLAEREGACALRAVATAAIRRAANRDALVEAVREAGGVEVAVLDAEDEARLAFAGATHTLAEDMPGEVAVADVGGGSCELAVGTVAAGMRWSVSFDVGSGRLTDEHIRCDPPAAVELESVRRHVERALGDLRPERPQLALAVGGSATSLQRLVGPHLDDTLLDGALGLLTRDPIADAARRLELDPERVRLLPAGILLLDGLSRRLSCPLEVGSGGLREGVILELAGGAVRGGVA